MGRRLAGSLLALIVGGCDAGEGGTTSADGAAPPSPSPPTADAMSDGGLPSVPELPDAAADAGPRAPESDAAAPAQGPGEGVPRPPDPGVINWRSCAMGTRDCGSLQVPLDYDAPTDATLRVAIMRHRAKGRRVGTLLLNPGGPGSSAIDFLGAVVDEGKSPLIQHFDLVAFDPRGVGYSTAIDCHALLQQWYAADPSPDDESEWMALDQLAARFASQCREAHAELLPHLGTINVARDMERVRAALGEPKLNYLGFSYGTQIGALYAELYPEQVGRMVLDGALPFGLSAADLWLQQAKGFELSLHRYYAWCRATPERCGWTRGADPAQAFLELQMQLETSSVPAPESDRPVGPGELLTGVASTLYGGEEGWRELSTALLRLRAGDGSLMMDLVDFYLERDFRDFAARKYTNREEANHAVNCIDRPPMTGEQIRAAVPRFSAEAPTFGLSFLTAELVCAHWGIPFEEPPRPRAMNAPPLLVLGTLGDPATPYAWSVALAEELASAVLLTAAGDVHTAYGRGDRCIDGAVEAYLLEGVVPPALRCDMAMPSALLAAPRRPERWHKRGLTE